MNRLSKREKTMLYLAAAVIGLFIIARIIIFPVFDKRDHLERLLAAKTTTLIDIQDLAAEFAALKERSDETLQRVTQKEAGFTLFSFLDRMAGETNLKDRIAYMKPSTQTRKDSPYKISLVEMKLQTITLEQLVLYLHRIETDASAIQVRRISITKTGKGKGHIDAVMEIESYTT